MAAEPTTAAEMMAATGPMVMVGHVLGLVRVGGGSGWLLGVGGDAPAIVGERNDEVSTAEAAVARGPTLWGNGPRFSGMRSPD